MLLVLAACVKSVPPPESGPRDDSGDSGAVDTAPLGPSLCGPWSGVQRVGTRWTYAPTEDYVARFGWTGTSTTTVAAIEAPLVTLQTDAHFGGAEGNFDLSRRETWTCDGGGARWVRSEVTSESRSGKTVFSATGVRTFDPPWLVRPPELTVLDAWVDRFTATMVLNEGTPEATAADCTSTVVVEANHHVKAGDRLARHLVVVCYGVASDSLWLEEGVGMIENDDLQLVRYDP